MSLSIYFCGSIRGGRQDVELYQHLIKKLKVYGKVLTEHIAHPDDHAALGGTQTDKEIYEKDMRWLTQCDVVVAEVTQPSHGVGVEIGRAIGMNKRMLCLFRPSTGKRLSALVRGAADDKTVFVRDYQEEEIESILKDFLEKTPASTDKSGSK